MLTSTIIYNICVHLKTRLKIWYNGVRFVCSTQQLRNSTGLCLDRMCVDMRLLWYVQSQVTSLKDVIIQLVFSAWSQVCFRLVFPKYICTTMKGEISVWIPFRIMIYLCFSIVSHTFSTPNCDHKLLSKSYIFDMLPFIWWPDQTNLPINHDFINTHVRCCSSTGLDNSVNKFSLRYVSEQRLGHVLFHLYELWMHNLTGVMTFVSLVWTLYT